MNDKYHGIVINVSQKDKSIFNGLRIIGSKKLFLGIIKFYKIEVDSRQKDEVIASLQKNMSNNLGPFKQEFYAHFYRGTELIIVYRDKTFCVTTEEATWKEAIEHGRSLGIAEKQLDFKPCKFEEETY